MVPLGKQTRITNTRVPAKFSHQPCAIPTTIAMIEPNCLPEWLEQHWKWITRLAVGRPTRSS